MSKVRLAIVRQKYRPDGGAERFISRALEALDDDSLDLNIITRSWQGEPKPEWHLHICNPKNGDASRASAALRWRRVHAGSERSLISYKATSALRAVIFFAPATACIASGWHKERASFRPCKSCWPI